MSSKFGEHRKRGRPRQFDEAAALDKAMEVFWRNGYVGTSLDDLVEATGASRASLYAMFGDKLAIFRQCMNLYGARFADRIDAALQENASGRDRLETTLNASADRLASGLAPPGCLRCNSTLELMGSGVVVDAILDEANEVFMKNLSRLLERAVLDGEIRTEQAEPLALFFTCVVDGMVTMAKAGVSRAQLATVIASAMGVWPAGGKRT